MIVLPEGDTAKLCSSVPCGPFLAGDPNIGAIELAHCKGPEPTNTNCSIDRNATATKRVYRPSRLLICMVQYLNEFEKSPAKNNALAKC